MSDKKTKSYFNKGKFTFNDRWLYNGKPLDHKHMIDFIPEHDMYLTTIRYYNRAVASANYTILDVYRSWLDMLVDTASTQLYWQVYRAAEGSEKEKEKQATKASQNYESMYV